MRVRQSDRRDREERRGDEEGGYGSLQLEREK